MLTLIALYRTLDFADNPASFVAVIKCGCADTFQSAYPQCLSCFIEVSRVQRF